MHVFVEYPDDETCELLKLMNKKCGILSKSPKNEPSRARIAAYRLVEETKTKAEQELL